jgi:hypothetical protein
MILQPGNDQLKSFMIDITSPIEYCHKNSTLLDTLNTCLRNMPCHIRCHKQSSCLQLVSSITPLYAFLNNITRRLQRELHTLGDHYVRSSQTKRNIIRVSAHITCDLSLTKLQTVPIIMNCRDYLLLLPTDLVNS